MDMWMCPTKTFKKKQQKKTNSELTMSPDSPPSQPLALSPTPAAFGGLILRFLRIL